MRLALRNVLFTVVVPGSGGVLVPWWLLTRGDAPAEPRAWYAAYRRRVSRWIPRPPRPEPT
jgi:protein-S-isoprenylcysteine O-methyltransferase Ste14